MLTHLLHPTFNRQPAIILVALVVLATNTLYSDTRRFNYEVTWQFITVGSLELNLSETSELRRVWLEAKSRGPLDRIWNYRASVLSTTYSSGGRTYELKTDSRWASEERFIRYSDGKIPVVMKFREMDSPAPLRTSIQKDGDSTDPLSILLELLRKIELRLPCDGSFKVYDGKRRYRVQTRTRTNSRRPEQDSPPMLACRAILDGATIESAADRRIRDKFAGPRLLRNVWPLARENRILDLDVARGADGTVYPAMFWLTTPLGKIVAKIQQ